MPSLRGAGEFGRAVSLTLCNVGFPQGLTGVFFLMSDSPDNLDTEPMMVGRRPVDRVTPMPCEGDLFAERYIIDRQLGKGGMGVVYKAEHSALDRTVAIKILKPPDRIEDDPKFDERFMREAAAAAKLHHANTITVHDFGQTVEGQLFIVMEFLEGRDLRTILRRAGPMSADRVIHIASQICRSLREAHDKGMIHRDLKPANIVLVDRDGDPDFVKVLDFGLVKYRDEDSELTLAGKFVGSPKYTSPEALDRRNKVDHRSDIYSLGILIYTMLAGQTPFSGDPVQILTAHLREPPPPLVELNPAVRSNPRLDRVIARCLEKDPAERFASMDALLESLRAASSERLGDVGSTTLALDSELPSQGRPGKRLAFLVLFGLFLTLLGWAFFLSAQSGDNESSPSSPETLSGEEAAAPKQDGESERAQDKSQGPEEPGTLGQEAGESSSSEPDSGTDTQSTSKGSSKPRRVPKKKPKKKRPKKSPEGYKSNPY